MTTAQPTNADTMTIREMCEAFDVTPRALRFYEAKELLAPIRIGQRRLFTGRDRARLKLILRGKRYGFSLEEIRQLLDLYDARDSGRTQLRRACEIGAEHLREMKARHAELGAAIEALEQELSWGRERLANPAAGQAAE